MWSIWWLFYIRFVRDIFCPFSQLRKVTISIVVSDGIEQYGLQWTGFHGFHCLIVFRKMCGKYNLNSNITELPVLYMKTNLVLRLRVHLSTATVRSLPVCFNNGKMYSTRIKFIRNPLFLSLCHFVYTVYSYLQHLDRDLGRQVPLHIWNYKQERR
jgi:hypothetical protein